MAVFDLYSKRLAAPQSTDIFSYDEIPKKLRIQTIQILEEVFSDGCDYQQSFNIWKVVVEVLRKEYGRFRLSNGGHDTRSELCGFLSECTTLEFLDTFELCGKALDNVCSNSGFANRFGDSAREAAKEAASDLNMRFREARIGLNTQTER